MQHKVALYTFGVFVEPADHAANAGFHERNDPNLAAVERAAGFVARSGYEDEPGPSCWGKQVFPRFYIERGDGWSPSTLSVWIDLESPMAFAYFGLHAEALSRGREWFRKPEWPPYVAWWVTSEHRPDWSEAVERHEFMHDHGPSARAFNFKQPFDARGDETSIDRDKVKALADRNAGLMPAYR